MMNKISWRCYICKEKRPDCFISILTVDMHPEDPGYAFHNIKYCNDNLQCENQAKSIKYSNGVKICPS
jgi:hypothetical protein